MNINDLYDIFLQSSGVVTDSRQAGKDCLFFALKGEKFNGNDFAEGALEAGAICVVVDEPRNLPDGKYFLTTNVLTTLQELAQLHRSRLGLTILGITGSNGKTTSKELIHSVLAQKFQVAATKGNLNNHIGVPLTLLSFDSTTQIGIVEMGANHIGEIARLCEIALPDCGLITNIGKAHLEGFGSLEGVIQAKTELYRHLQSTGGTIFFNYDNSVLRSALGSYNQSLCYGKNRRCRVSGEITRWDPFLQVSLQIDDDTITIDTHLVGDYNLDNVLAAAVAGIFFGVDSQVIKDGISSYVPANNRSQMVKGASNTIIMDAYNANPSSMQASIRNFLHLSPEGLQKVMILGDMLELGAYADAEHQAIVDETSHQKGIQVYLVGAHFMEVTASMECHQFPDVQSLKEYLSQQPIRNAQVLLKGSRGIHLEELMETLVS